MRTLIFFLLIATSTLAQPRTFLDVNFKQVGDEILKMDIFLPDSGQKPYPVIVWIHGGGWRMGDKSNPRPLSPFVDRGYAVASISYRYSKVAKYPAQLIDCKDAVRFLRLNAGQYGLDPARIGVWGSSAGGHLAALLGTTANEPAFSRLCHYQNVSDRVRAVVDECGPTDMVNYVAELIPLDNSRDWNAPSSYIYQLFGAPPDQVKKLAKQASAFYYIDKTDSPCLILHGLQDNVVPPIQSEKFYRKLCQKGVKAVLKQFPDDNHAIKKAHLIEDVVAFFATYL
jgi:acetyl esterase/lipase